VIGYALLHDQYYLSSALLVYAGLSDWVRIHVVPEAMALTVRGQVDGYIARRFNMRSVLGTILDPAADKALMTTLTVTLAMKGLLPGKFTVH
jgi:cardiolipin synthase